MLKTFNKIGDRLLDRLLPTANAAGVCWLEFNTPGTRCRTCCWSDCCGGGCGPWDYC